MTRRRVVGAETETVEDDAQDASSAAWTSAPTRAKGAAVADGVRPDPKRLKALRRPAVDEVADVAGRLAVLLAAGVPPAAAWRYLAELPHRGTADGVTVRVIRAASRAALRGGDVAHAIASGADGDARIRRNGRRGTPRAPDEVRRA